MDKPQKNGGNREALVKRLRCFGKAGENCREISQKRKKFELLPGNITRIVNLQLEGGQLLFEEYKIQYIENTSWKVQAYSIYALVVNVSEIKRVSVAKEGDF